MNCHRLGKDCDNDNELMCENFMNVELCLVKHKVLTTYKNKIGELVNCNKKISTLW